MRKRQNKDGTAHFNNTFYELRKTNGYSQTELGRALGGYHKQTISNVESGLSAGKLDFWRRFQKLFNIPDADMWALINGVEAPEKHVI